MQGACACCWYTAHVPGSGHPYPRPHYHTSFTYAPTNPPRPAAIYYWLGRYDGSQFLIKDATGPLRLDLGRTLYAASLWPDPNTVGVRGLS